MPVEKTLEAVKREHLIGMQPNAALDVVSKMRHGEMPANSELRKVIERTEQTLEQRKHDPRTTRRSSEFIAHAEQFLHAAEQVLQQRNQDEHLQHVFNAEQGALGVRGINAPVMKDAFTSTLRSMGSTITMMARSNEFRSNILELVEIMDNIFTFSSMTAAEGTVKQKTKAVLHNAAERLDPDSTSYESDEQIRTLFERLSNVMQVMANNKHYKQSINALFAMVDAIQENAMSPREENITRDQERLREEAKLAVQSFTGNHSVDPFLSSARTVIRRVSRDIYMRELFHDLRGWLEDVLNLPVLLQRKEYIRSGQELLQRAKAHSRDYEYDRDYQKLSRETHILLDEIRHDEIFTSLRESGDQLLSDFTTETGDHQRTLNFAALSEMKDIIAPVVIDQLEHVPVPRIEGCDETYDYVIDNIIFSARDVLPSNISIETKTTSKIGIDGPDKGTRAVVKMTVKQITTHIPNVKFFFKRKAFPRLTDEGTVDVDIKGRGASLKIWLYMDELSPTPQFSHHSVQFILHGFDLHFRRDTKHTFLLNMGTKIFRAPLEKRIEAAATMKVEHIMDFLSQRLNMYLARASRESRNALKNTSIGGPISAALSLSPLPVGMKAAQGQRAPVVAATAVSDKTSVGSTHKTLEQLGYQAGTPGGAAVSLEEIWQNKLLVLKRMGYKAGSPGGFAVPLDGDMYKWVPQRAMRAGSNLQLNKPLSAQSDNVFKNMGYKAGTPGGFAVPLEGDMYKWSSGSTKGLGAAAGIGAGAAAAAAGIGAGGGIAAGSKGRSSDTDAILKRMGYKIGTPGGAAVPIEGAMDKQSMGEKASSPTDAMFKRMGYKIGTPGGAAVPIEEGADLKGGDQKMQSQSFLSPESAAIFERMGYQAGTPGGAALPISGDQYKFSKSSKTETKESKKSGLQRFAFGINAPDHPSLKRMGYNLGSPGGAASPREGDLYQYSPPGDDVSIESSTPMQQYVFGSTPQHDPSLRKEDQVLGMSQAPSTLKKDDKASTHLAARDWQGDKEPSDDFFKSGFQSSKQEWTPLPGGGVSASRGPDPLKSPTQRTQ
ncbi:hypothetical protein CAOG_03783 [Capsaspora owczarzaki ATCC 30864]|nr:hypothetical protein CAOG_03783 [Capsaspora owczarzaki ATCC 30864]|eukprot:XP_004363511.1 hypothetical protein CAOG_03783 [Capsaspora owczarzaki ATCC 30864]